jgi:hypothetical protein
MTIDRSSPTADTDRAIDPARVPVIEVDDVTKSYPSEPPVQALRG